MFVLSTYIYIYMCVLYFYITYNDITFCINRCLMHLRRYNDIMIWYICLPTLALSSSPPKKKQKHSQREWKSQARHLNPYGPGGLVTTGPLWRVHGDVWKVRGQRVFGKPRFCSRKNRGTAESNLVTSGRTKWLLGSRSYHNTRIPSWFFGEDVNDCECIYMYLFWGWFGDGWRGTTCVFLKLAYYAWYFTYFGYVLWSSKPTWFVFSLVAQVVDPKKCWFPICKLLDPCLGPLGHGLKKWHRKPPGAF